VRVAATLIFGRQKLSDSSAVNGDCRVITASILGKRKEASWGVKRQRRTSGGVVSVELGMSTGSTGGDRDRIFISLPMSQKKSIARALEVIVFFVCLTA